jgi:pyruvate/2-oxoglutarate dehydrogenase complex dihydrolipoamide acyltransferase (E2) component
MVGRRGSLRELVAQVTKGANPMKDAPYSTEPFHPFRQLIIDGMDLAARGHHIHGLVQVDVTEARERIRQIKERTGERLSFTGFVVY